MTEEEFFRKNYPESCYGDKPLSPHWDFFQDGVEFGERQSEKKIEELQEENLKLEAKVRTLEIEQHYCMPNCSKVADLEKQIQIDAEQILALQEQNGELTDKVKELEKNIETLNKVINNVHVVRIIQLTKENAGLKDNFKIAKDNEYEYQSLLTKAKEIIKKLRALYFNPVVTNDDVKQQDEILNEAEQFLKE